MHTGNLRLSCPLRIAGEHATLVHSCGLLPVSFSSWEQQTVTSCLHIVGGVTPKNFPLVPVELSEIKKASVYPHIYTGTKVGGNGAYFSQETQSGLSTPQYDT